MKQILATGLLALALGACTTYGQSENSAGVPPQTAEDACGAGALQGYVGQEGNAENRAALEAAAADGFRWIPDGTPVTLDYRPDRLNVSLDADGMITRIGCY